ncbi:MAG: thioredoxin family protein [Flavobacteriales bacterium]|nr:thioredoxin family protein [Flavobacteriales bacterium]
MIKEQEAIGPWYESDYEGSMTFEAFVDLTAQLHAQGLTTGNVQNEMMMKYSLLGEQRLSRLIKTQKLDDRLVSMMSALPDHYTILVITEAWCGDGPFGIVIFELLARLCTNVTTRYVLRDDNPALMDAFHTDGGSAIPIAICIDSKGQFVWRWGPRPKPVQDRIKAYKSDPNPTMSYEDLIVENQKWYNNDKGVTAQNEVMRLIEKMVC